jgi:hypothetical protein
MRFSSQAKKGTILLVLLSLVMISSLFATLEIPKSDIIFSHKRHSDQPCDNCHDKIYESDKSEDKNLPTMDICTQCHDGTTLPNECSVCHKDKENPQALVRPKRDFIFSHKKHLERKTECVFCHGDVTKKDKLTSENMPDMGKCYECHEGTKVSNQCELCHAKMKLRKYHPDDWLHSHQYQSVTKTGKCVQCHQNQDQCQKCHRGDNLFQKTHPLNYNFTHGMDAKSKEKDCLSCHLTKQFCDDCHAQEGAKPLNHSIPDWAGSKHGEYARKDMELCASCHDTADPICTWCHQDKNPGRGNDHDIHPTGFASNLGKGPWHEDDGYFCYECHTKGPKAGVGFCGYCHGDKD